jgi:cytochrome P450
MSSPAPLVFQQIVDDPYPVYAQLRAQGPTPTGQATPQYLLSRHAHVRAALHDARLSAERTPGLTGGLLVARSSELAFDPEERSMLASDPPDHTRLRGLVNRAFTPRRIEALSGRIEAITEELLDRVGSAAEFDLMSALAGPLPVILIAELLGIPVQDHQQLRDWSSALVALIDGSSDPASITAAGRAQRELRDYLRGAIALRRREPRDDLLSALIAARDERDALSDPELIATCRLLLIAGHETTTNLIGNGVVALLEHPDQLAALRADTDLGRSAVEELLRYDGPVQATRRVSKEELQIDGVTIPAKSLVVLMLGSANRDPEVFADPDRLDLARDPNPHLAFGHGIHACLGAPLARLEGRIALQSLLARFPRLELAQPPRRRPTFLLRGYQELRLRVRG